jgi:hypothetical protein|tara:strand:- start:391 stop:924 length:534 start_codon:yes stop_codon:yes gene_type:complete
MTPEAWKRMIGEPAWVRLARAAGPAQGREEQVAAILTAASEAGFTVPAQAPTINRSGTVASWPSGLAALTAEGLRRYWASKGHGFILLRVPQLLKAMDGPLLPRLQEVLMAYEEQCSIDGKAPLPGWADLRYFVGGTRPRLPGSTRDLTEGLVRDSPAPESASSVRVAAPGVKPEYR